MELSNFSKYKMLMKHSQVRDNNAHSSILNISSCQNRSNSENRTGFPIAQSNSTSEIIDLQSTRANDFTGRNYPMNMSTLMAIGGLSSPKIMNVKAIKLIRDNTSKLKSRNMLEKTIEFTDHPFIKLSTDHYNNANKINSVDNPNSIIANGTHDSSNLLKPQYEPIQRLISRKYPRKPFNNGKFLKIVKKYSECEKEKDMTVKNKVFHESKSEKIMLRPETNILPMHNKAEKKKDNQDKLNKLRDLLANFNQDYNSKIKKTNDSSSITTIPTNTRSIYSDSLRQIFRNKKNGNENKNNLLSHNIFLLPNRKINSIEKRLLNSQSSSRLDSPILLKRDFLKHKSERNFKLNNKNLKNYESLICEIALEKERLNSILSRSYNNQNDIKDNNSNKKKNIFIFNNNNNSVKHKLNTIQSIPEINYNDNEQQEFNDNVKSIHDNMILLLPDKSDVYLHKRYINSTIFNKETQNKLQKDIVDAKNKELLKEIQAKAEDENKQLLANNSNNNQIDTSKRRQLFHRNTFSKKSDLKTDTDTKGRNTKYQNGTESKNIVSLLVSDLKPKDTNNKITPMNDNNTFVKHCSCKNVLKKISLKLNCIMIPKANTYKSQLSQHITKKTSNFIDKIAANNNSSIRNIDEIIINRKQDLFIKQYKLYSNKIMNKKKSQSTKCICNYDKNTNYILRQFKDETYNSTNEIDFDFSIFAMNSDCNISFSIGKYICKQYLLIDPIDFSDYLFNIKTDFFINNARKKTIKRGFTMKSSQFVNPNLFSKKVNTERNILLVQKFIQYDYNLSNENIGFNNNPLLLNYNNTFNSISAHSPQIKPKKKINRSKAYLSSNCQWSLDILKHKPFYQWRQDTQSKNKIKHIVNTNQVPEGLKPLIQEVNNTHTNIT